MGFSSYTGPSAQSGTLTVSGSITGSVGISATPFQKVEDQASTNADVGVAIFEVRRDAMTGSSATSDGDYATKNQDADGFSYVRDKSYDSPSGAGRSFNINPTFTRNVQTPVAIISAAQNVTTAWVDLGPEIPLQGYTQVGLWLNVDINDAQNIRIRCLAKHTSAGTNEYYLPVTAVDVSGVPFNLKVQGEYIELDVDADQMIVLNFDVFNWIPFVQFQVMAEVAGATAGQIDEAHVTYGFGG